MKYNGGIDSKVNGRRVGPSHRGHLVASISTDVSVDAFPLVFRADREVSGLVQQVAGISQASLIDDQLTLVDVDSGHDGHVRNDPGADCNANAGKKRNHTANGRIGEW